MKELLIGTSGYDYPEWKGVFYPEEVKRADFLSYYATKFNALELNFSFYGMPTAQRMQSFYDRTQGTVAFSVKANRLLTHEVDSSWQTVAQDFKTAVTPLLEKDSLSSVLFQFPESFHYTNDNRIYLGKLINEFQGFPVVVEFRHTEWIKESVFEGLEKMHASLCFCDCPELKNLPKMNLTSENVFTSPFIGPSAYMRLHGRNENAWYADNSSEETAQNGSARYNYDYSNKELAQFIPTINAALNDRKILQIFFNNHPNGNGAKNALALKNMIQISNLKIF